MKFNDLISDPRLTAVLKANPRYSVHSRQPLSLVNNGPRSGLVWENCKDADWWHGQQEGVYTRQIRIPVTDEQIIAAAKAAGISQNEIDEAFISRPAEIAEENARNEANYTAFVKKEAAWSAQLKLKSRQQLLIEKPWLTDPQIAAAAMAELESHLRQNRRIAHMTRKYTLVDHQGTPLAKFQNSQGMQAWLFQHGFSASIDDRRHFLAAAL